MKKISLYRGILYFSLLLIAPVIQLSANCNVYVFSMGAENCLYGARYVSTNWIRENIYVCTQTDSNGICLIDAWELVSCEVNIWDVYECVDPCNGALETLKNEYSAKGIPVPAPYQLTNNRGSGYYTYAELTGGYWDAPVHYPCAFLDPYALNKLDAVRACVGYHFNLTNGYRNPTHHYDHPQPPNPPRDYWSAHMTGQAFDASMKVNGEYNCDRWYDIAICAHGLGLWVEPIRVAKDHVHFEASTHSPRTDLDIMADYDECLMRYPQ